jgi:ammonium transporter, Amt family
MFVEWIFKGKPSVLGICSGAVAGLVAITPASGFVEPGGALVIGFVAGAICFWSATSLKHMLGYDDSLDTFGVHGVGGIVGALLTGVFAFQPFTGTLDPKTNQWTGGNVGGLQQFESQVVAVCVTLIWSGVMSFVLLKIVDAIIGLRVTADEEMEGLDVVLHGERLG